MRCAKCKALPCSWRSSPSASASKRAIRWSSSRCLHFLKPRDIHRMMPCEERAFRWPSSASDQPGFRSPGCITFASRSPVIRKLQRNPRRVGLEMGDHGLQLILLGAADAQGFALNRRVDLQFQIFDRALNLLGGVLVDAALELHLLA